MQTCVFVRVALRNLARAAWTLDDDCRVSIREKRYSNIKIEKESSNMARTQANLEPLLTLDTRAGERACIFHVVGVNEALPAKFIGYATAPRGKDAAGVDIPAAREVIRIAGGCKGMDPKVIEAMPDFYINAFRRVETQGWGPFKREVPTRLFHGTAFSGGTAKIKNGVIEDGMVTVLPAVLASANPCVAISTTPRTDDMALHGQTGGLIMSDGGDRIDFRQHAAAVIQRDAGSVLDWDGDVPIYLKWMEGMKMQGFATALNPLNGGGITRGEIYGALRLSIPVIPIANTGRETDAFCEAVMGNWKPTDAKFVDEAKAVFDSVDVASLVSIVPMLDVPAFRSALIQHGFLN